MTLGMIFECGPQGADKQVCEYLAQYLRPDAVLRSRTMDNKGTLLRDGGRVAAQLLRDGCSCVVIVWDLRPAWPERRTDPCRVAECNLLSQRLADAGISTDAPVHLICIEQELEYWLLANERALSAHLSTDAHGYDVKRIRRPDNVAQPKASVIKHFKMARNWRYDDKIDALRVLKASDIDLSRMRRSACFSRFEQKLLEC